MKTLLALLLMVSPALAANQPTYPLSAIRHDPQAPKRLLYMYQGDLDEKPQRSREGVRRECNRLSIKHGFGPMQPHKNLGCSIWAPDHSWCEVVYLVGKPHVYWHEIAHCNGGAFHD